MNMANKVPIVQATFYNNNTKQIENCYPMTSAKGVVMSDGKTLEESFSDKADNSVVVHKSGDEEILGRKTFDDLRANGFCLSNDGDWNRWVSAFYSFLKNQGVIQFGTEEDWSVILRNIADPEYEDDAATKGYVDSKIAGAASIPVLQYGALINNNIPSVFEREEQAIANAPIYAKILSGEVQFFAAKIGGVGLFVSRSISSNKSSFELIGLDFKNLAEILITININQSGLTQAVTLSKNLQSVLTDTDGGYGQRVAELETGKANLLHQHTVADITNFPELYYDATAFFTSAYPSDKYEELLEAVKAKKTVYATLDEEGDISYVFFTSLANSDASSSRVLLTTIFVDGSYLYLNTFVLRQSGMTRMQENITGKADKATTLAGYGIADAYTKSEVDIAIEGKQDTIVDLDDIREGAAKGATALQSYTETDPVYTADKPSLALKSELNGLSTQVTNLQTKDTEQDGRLVALEQRPIVDKDLTERVTDLENDRKYAHNLANVRIKSLSVDEPIKVCDVPMVLIGSGAPSAANVPMNWDKVKMGEWFGIPNFIGQMYVNISASNNALYVAVNDTAVNGWKTA